MREIGFGLARVRPWERIRSRNRWFGLWAVRTLERLRTQGRLGNATSCFAYSYAAREVFEWCKRHGYRCILGQVDPGPAEWGVISELREKHPEWGEAGCPPDAYWDDWRVELELADHIVVNSAWSARLLEPEIQGNAAKLAMIPLAYEPSFEIPASSRELRQERNLKVLFLGQVCLRKGIHEFVEAAKLLEGQPIEWDVVGEHGRLPAGLPSNVRFHGRVSRRDARDWYARADVFVLPTHSDGFALTQLEAINHGLPVIATPHCGSVVEHGSNGWLVPVEGEAELAECIRMLAKDHDLLDRASVAARQASKRFQLDKLYRNMACLG